jgi:putative methylase
LGRQKKTPSKRQLEIQLEKLANREDPNLGLEQYPVSSEAAAELLYMAGFEHHDLDGKIVDLGTGTGRLAIGSALMGAENILGLDLDRESVRVAIQNGKRLRTNIDWVIGDLDSLTGDFDTVLMNPPYGTRVKHQDTRFLSKALQLAPVTYTLHKSATRSFLVQFVEKKGGQVDQVRGLKMQIPHLFGFHKKKWQDVQVDLYRIVR